MDSRKLFIMDFNMQNSGICRYDDSQYFQKVGETREEWRKRLKEDLDRDKANMTQAELEEHNKDMEEFVKSLTSTTHESVTIEDANRLLGAKKELCRHSSFNRSHHTRWFAYL